MALKKSELYSSRWQSCDELRGGIPDRGLDALKPSWQVFPAVHDELFQEASRPGYSALRVAAKITQTIFGHKEFTAFNATALSHFAQWKAANAPHLKGFAQDGHAICRRWACSPEAGHHCRVRNPGPHHCRLHPMLQSFRIRHD